MASLGFAADVKKLFTSYDRDQMRFVFDLWRYEDVKIHAPEILARLELGDMPCDQAWPAAQIATFRSWLEQGSLP
jgi:hypothetical protein